jgi:hypothetical protein
VPRIEGNKIERRIVFLKDAGQTPRSIRHRASIAL